MGTRANKGDIVDNIRLDRIDYDLDAIYLMLKEINNNLIKLITQENTIGSCEVNIANIDSDDINKTLSAAKRKM